MRTKQVLLASTKWQITDSRRVNMDGKNFLSEEYQPYFWITYLEKKNLPSSLVEARKRCLKDVLSVYLIAPNNEYKEAEENSSSHMWKVEDRSWNISRSLFYRSLLKIFAWDPLVNQMFTTTPHQKWNLCNTMYIIIYYFQHQACQSA